MAEFTVNTAYGRKIKVTQVSTEKVAVYVEDTGCNYEVATILSNEQAKEIATALQLASEGKLQEQKYYLHVIPESKNGFINVELDGSTSVFLDNNINTDKNKTQFTQKEIASNPLLKPFEQCKVPVPVYELED